MSSRSLNQVQLIGNLTRDPELRYTPTGAAVCTMGLATNRSWTMESGEKKEETEFHRVVAWNKLAELCSQLLAKGRKIYVMGRLRTNSWQAQDGTQRSTTEVVIEDMIILDSRRPASPELQRGEPVVGAPGEATPVSAGESAGAGGEAQMAQATESATRVAQPAVPQSKPVAKKKSDTEAPAAPATEDVNPDDIPF